MVSLPANAAPRAEDIAELVEEFLRRLCSGGETASFSALVDHDLTFSQVRVLMVLAYVDRALPINQIAAHLGLTLATAGRNVDRLLHEGLVERREASDDRRVKLVELTSTGRDLISRHFACHRTVLAAFTQRLPGPDRVRLAAALRPILDGDLLATTPPTLAPRAKEPGAPRPQHGLA